MMRFGILVSLTFRYPMLGNHILGGISASPVIKVLCSGSFIDGPLFLFGRSYEKTKVDTGCRHRAAGKSQMSAQKARVLIYIKKAAGVIDSLHINPLAA